MKRILVGAAIAISAMAVLSRITLAQSAGLGGTSWESMVAECFTSVDFSSDGTAVIWEGGDQTDTAHWTLEGNALHIVFDTLYGGIEGTYDGGDQIEATETWRSHSTQVVHNDPCSLRKNN